MCIISISIMNILYDRGRVIQQRNRAMTQARQVRQELGEAKQEEAGCARTHAT